MFNKNKQALDVLKFHQLKNGLSLYTAEFPEEKNVFVSLTIRAGASLHTKENAGLFHLLEHLIFKANSHFKNAVAADKELRDSTLSHNATTETDATEFWAKVESRNVKRYLAYLNAAIRTPLFLEDELEKEKEVIINELNSEKESDTFVQTFSSLLFPEHPYCFSAAGSKVNVQNASVAQLQEIHNTYYVPENAMLYIAGNIDEKLIVKFVEAIFGTWKNTGIERAHPLQLFGNPLKEERILLHCDSSLKPEETRLCMYSRSADAEYDKEETFLCNAFNKIVNCFTINRNTSLCELNNGKDVTLDTSQEPVDIFYQLAGAVIDFGERFYEQTIPSFKNEFRDNFETYKNEMYETIEKELGVYDSFLSGKKNQKINQPTGAEQENKAVNLSDYVKARWVLYGSLGVKNELESVSIFMPDTIDYLIDTYFAKPNKLFVIGVSAEVYKKIHKLEEVKKFEWEKISSFVPWYEQEGFLPDENKLVANSAAVFDRTEFEGTLYSFKALEADYSAAVKNVGITSSYTELPLTKETLNNGIEVYMLHNKDAGSSAIAVGVLGGVRNMAKDEYRLEDVLFAMMAEKENSRSWSFSDSVPDCESYVPSEGSYLVINSCSERDLRILADKMIDPYIPTMYDFNDYVTETDEALISGRAEEKTLESVIVANIISSSKDLGHPVLRKIIPNQKCFDNLSSENVKELYEKIFIPSAIKIVAIGKIPPAKKLKEDLNRTFGQIHSTRPQYRKLPLPTLSLTEKIEFLSTDDEAGNVYRAVLRTSDESCKGVEALANDIFENILYNVIRVKHNLCYTPYIDYSVSNCMIEVFSGVGAEYYNALPSALKEAHDILLSGKYIKDVQGTEYVLGDISEILEVRKSDERQVFLDAFDETDTYSYICEAMSNVLCERDIHFAKEMILKLEKATKDDVVQIFKKQWIDAPCVWIFEVSKKHKKLIDEGLFVKKN